MISTIVRGVVTGGNRIGRTLGFPTANIELNPDLQVVNGVYAVKVTTPDGCYNGMANVGFRPTVSDSTLQRFLEINLFGYDGELYGKTVEVELLEFFRDERKFSSLTELKKQVELDRRLIEEYFKKTHDNVH